MLIHMIIGKTQHTSLGNPDATDSDGFLIDIDVQSIAEDNTKSREDRTQDIKEFFYPSFDKIIQGRTKKYRKCKKCLWVSFNIAYCICDAKYTAFVDSMKAL